MDEVRLGGTSVRILPVVRGPPSETAAVAAAIESTSPRVVAMSIGPEELETLRAYDGPALEPDNVEEEVYVTGLSAWEAPVKPPPCFKEAIRIADRRGIRLEGLDLDEAAYTEAYVECVGTWELMMQGRRNRRLLQKRFRATTPRDFVLEWDAQVNSTPGFRKLQARREAHMATRLRDVAGRAGPILALIEVERAKGTLTALTA